MLKVEDITFAYEHKKILDRISFHAKPGEVIGILGSNGTGKSTLFKNILLLLKSQKGYVEIDEVNLMEISSRERAKKIAYVPQFMDLIFSITVFDFILMGAKINAQNKDLNIAKKKTAEIIEIFELQDLAFKDMRKMSGGERQRAYIARAFAQEPKVIILDEPTSNLDFKYKNEVLKILSNLAKEKYIAIVIAIHDLNVASKFCDKFLIIKNGIILANGNSNEIFKKEIIEETYDTPVDIIDYKDQKIVVFV